MLQDDGHLVRVLLQKILRRRDPGGAGLEGDVEMMLTGKAVAHGCPLQCRLDDAAKGFLGQQLVIHQVVGGPIFRHHVLKHY